VGYAMGRGLSQRRACTLLGVGRSALHYCSVKLVKDTPVLARMAELSAQYPRYGYRRVAIFLGRDGLSTGRGISPLLGVQNSPLGGVGDQPLM
jgi:putative transposase